MGFSALDGMPMGTRSGQLDPGVILHFLDRGMSAAEITALLYKESGLLGLSGLSHDMRTLARLRHEGARLKPLITIPSASAARSAPWPPSSAVSTRSSSPAASARTPPRSAPAPSTLASSASRWTRPPTRATPPHRRGPRPDPRPAHRRGTHHRPRHRRRARLIPFIFPKIPGGSRTRGAAPPTASPTVTQASRPSGSPRRKQGDHHDETTRRRAARPRGARVTNSTLGRYTEVGPGSILLNTTLGDYSYTTRFCDLANTTVGKFSNIAAFTRIGPTDHPLDRASLHHFMYRSADYWPDAEHDADFFAHRESRRTTIGHDTWIGHGAIIRPEVTLGHGAVVAAGPWSRRTSRPTRSSPAARPNPSATASRPPSPTG
jgi:acetyltransferase-like isoleucine patch superfamily enzyme